MPTLGSSEASHYGADSAPRCPARIGIAHVSVAPPRDPHPPLLLDAEGSWNSLSGVRRMSLDHGDSSSEASYGMRANSAGIGVASVFDFQIVARTIAIVAPRSGVLVSQVSHHISIQGSNAQLGLIALLAVANQPRTATAGSLGTPNL